MAEFDLKLPKNSMHHESTIRPLHEIVGINFLIILVKQAVIELNPEVQNTIHPPILIVHASQKDSTK